MFWADVKILVFLSGAEPHTAGFKYFFLYPCMPPTLLGGTPPLCGGAPLTSTF